MDGTNAAARHREVLSQIFRRGFLQPSARGRLMGLVVEAMDHEWNAFAQVAEDDSERGKAIE